jgi:hypothetical protein
VLHDIADKEYMQKDILLGHRVLTSSIITYTDIINQLIHSEMKYRNITLDDLYTDYEATTLRIKLKLKENVITPIVIEPLILYELRHIKTNALLFNDPYYKQLSIVYDLKKQVAEASKYIDSITDDDYYE